MTSHFNTDPEPAPVRWLDDPVDRLYWAAAGAAALLREGEHARALRTLEDAVSAEYARRAAAHACKAADLPGPGFVEVTAPVDPA